MFMILSYCFVSCLWYLSFRLLSKHTFLLLPSSLSRLHVHDLYYIEYYVILAEYDL